MGRVELLSLDGRERDNDVVDDWAGRCRAAFVFRPPGRWRRGRSAAREGRGLDDNAKISKDMGIIALARIEPRRSSVDWGFRGV